MKEIKLAALAVQQEKQEFEGAASLAAASREDAEGHLECLKKNIQEKEEEARAAQEKHDEENRQLILVGPTNSLSPVALLTRLCLVLRSFAVTSFSHTSGEGRDGEAAAGPEEERGRGKEGGARKAKGVRK